MANRLLKFTKRAVDALKAGGAVTVYWDGELTGFGIRVRKSGRKNYVVQTRVASKLSWFTIGQQGPITLEDPGGASASAPGSTMCGFITSATLCISTL